MDEHVVSNVSSDGKSGRVAGTQNKGSLAEMHLYPFQGGVASPFPQNVESATWLLPSEIKQPEKETNGFYSPDESSKDVQRG